MIYAIPMSIIGSCLYRWRGHASKYKRYFPRPFNQIAFALPYALVCIPAYWPDQWYVPAAVLIVSTLGVLTGHGRFMDLGKWRAETKFERIEFLIKPFMRILPPYWYDALGLAVTGLIVTIPAGMALLNPAIAMSGVLKAPAYMIGHAIHKDGNRATALGEWLTGAVLWGSVSFFIA